MSSEFYKNKEETVLYKVTKKRILSRRYIGNENIHMDCSRDEIYFNRVSLENLEITMDCSRDEIYYNRVSLENLEITEAEYKELNAKFSLLHLKIK